MIIGRIRSAKDKPQIVLQITLLLGLIGVYFTLEPVAYVQPTNGLPFPLAMSL